MSLRLQGPLPFDPATPGDAARAALLGAVDAPMAGRPSAGRRPGLYLLWRDDGAPALVGLWISLGARFAGSAAGEGGARRPPFAEELLTALTEAVWWRSLPVDSTSHRSWRPVLVTEYLPALAARAEPAPPGSEVASLASEEASDEGAWLDLSGQPAAPSDAASVTAELVLDDDALPAERSLLSVVVGELRWSGGTHRGRWSLGGLPGEGLGDDEVSELDRWVRQVREGEHAPVPGTLPALRLPGRRVGYLLPGWLDGELRLVGARSGATTSGELADRDVGAVWLGLARRTTLVTGSVVALVLCLAVLVGFASQPRVRSAPPAPSLEAQPAMSVCSADHQPFVAQLRCQAAWLAEGGALAESPCAEGGAGAGAVDGGADLQAAWCGLVDAEASEGHSGRGALARAAAAQACFEVLGRPWSYEATADGRRTGLADASLFLDSPSLAVRGLVELTGELEAACAHYGGQLEAQVEGAILATHVGSGEGEGAALRELVAGHLARDLPRELEPCLEAGLDEGVAGDARYAELCGGQDEADQRWDAAKGWRALAGEPEGTVLSRYTRVRFGLGGPPPSERLWACEAELSSPGLEARGAAERWDLRLPLAPGWRRTGLVQSQLVLDAGLRALDEGAEAGPCWAGLQRRLARYRPVHPLSGGVDPAGWPSEEQQLCGQICAGRFGLGPSPGDWVTPGTDLDLCLAPDGAARGDGDGFDRLGLPWSGEDSRQGGRVAPSAEQVCAFHLVAQGAFDNEVGTVLPGGLPAPMWAGETVAGSRVAGGAEGLAVEAAHSMGRYGRARSRATCGYVAAQCFAEGLLEVAGDERLEPYQWPDRWRRWVEALGEQSSGELAGRSPWCARVRGYLSDAGELPEGELDYPCAVGVDEVRQAMDAQVLARARAQARTGSD